MLNKIISFSIQNKLIIGLFVLGLIGYGSYQVTKLPIDAVPDITNNQVQVITVVPSLGAPDVERLITFPIEQANSNIPGLKEIRSFSRFGLSLITIVFDDEVDIYWARQQVTERLKIAEAQIPSGLGSPELSPVTTGLGEIYQYVIRAKTGFESKYDETALRTIQDWTVRRQLIGVKGVADVSSFGGKLKQYEIGVDANRLSAFHVTMSDVFMALEKNNENTGGAYIEKKSTVLYIRSEGLIGSIDDIKNIVVKNMTNGTPLLIKDVAEVKIGHAIRYGAMTYNDEGEAAGAVVMMLKGANSSEVIQNVKERIKQIEKTLPEGIEIVPFLDRTKMVDNAIGTVSKNLLEGALIVVFVLVLFLGNFRAGFLVASVIPLAMLFAIILMNLFGVSGNLMSLGALDFGLIVDGAVIIVEAVMHSLLHRKLNQSNHAVTQAEMDTEVTKSASRMMNSAVFGQIIILVVYLPIFALEGIEGKMFKPMAQAVAFALLGAFLLSLTYIPMMSALFLNKKLSHKKNISDKLMDILVSAHQMILIKVLKFPRTVIGIAVALMGSAIILFSNMGGEFIPELPEGDFALETRVLTGSNIETTADACLKASHILKEKFPEVEKIVGKIGSGEIPIDPMPMDAADLMIILKDKSEWTSADSWEELSDKMSTALEDVPGVTFSFQYPVAMRFNELMTGAKQDVVCKIFGENLDSLSKYATVLGEIVGEINGAENVFVEPIDGVPQLIIHYNRDLLAQFGLTISEINQVVNTAFAGQSSGLVFEDEKRFDLVVRLADQNRRELADVQNLLIPLPNGQQIPLHQVANVAIEESVNQIQREDAKRRIIVGFNVKGRDVQSIVKELQQVVETRMPLPSGYYIKYGGAFENLEAAKSRLALAVPLSLLLIFLFLFFAFGSIKQGLLIYSAIPLSAIGGVWFLFARGMPFSISAGVGFIALFGVAVLNGIVLLAEFNSIKAEGESDSKKIVLRGTKVRLRPVLMTAFVASLGFLPMAISQGAGAEVQRPLATVVIGGLLLATLLTLFVLPVLYVLFEGIAKPKFAKKKIIANVIVLFGFVGVQAQPTISLEAALDSALKNNLNRRQEAQLVEVQNSLRKSAFNLPATNLTSEYGQINSAYNDNRFGCAQTFAFPTVYMQQKELLTQSYNSQKLKNAASDSELKKQLSQVYSTLIYLRQKKSWFMRNDSIYAKQVEIVSQQFSRGDQNIMDLTNAKVYLGQLRMQQNKLDADIQQWTNTFHWLIQTQLEYVPADLDYPFEFAALLTDSAAIIDHPYLQYIEQQKTLSKVQTQLERSKMLPDITIGYNNQSIQGIGADDVKYQSRDRFQSIQVGVGLPIFYGAQKARIKAAKAQETASEFTYQLEYSSLKNEMMAVLHRFQSQKMILDYYEQSSLPEAETLALLANNQFKEGAINYSEWALLMNQVVLIQNGYLDAKNDVQQSAILIQYYTSK